MTAKKIGKRINRRISQHKQSLVSMPDGHNDGHNGITQSDKSQELEVSRSWTFTLNNYTMKDEQLFKDLVCNYIIFGREVGEKGTRHLQGTIMFTKPCRFSGVKKIHPSCHWEKCRSFNDSINYCMKEKDYFIKDSRKQGCRSDIEDIITEINAGSLITAITAYPTTYVKYHNGLEKYTALIKCKPRNFKPTVEWLWGKTGAGKTRYVVDKEPDLYICNFDLKWWDGYMGQEAILIDDFREGQIPFTDLLKLLDRYPCKVQVKGGFRDVCSLRMYITCPLAPKYEFLETHNEDLQQLIRRIDRVTLVTEVA